MPPALQDRSPCHCTASARIAALFRPVPALYVADGHHRSAAASRVHALRKGKPGEHDRFLAVYRQVHEMIRDEVAISLKRAH